MILCYSSSILSISPIQNTNIIRYIYRDGERERQWETTRSFHKFVGAFRIQQTGNYHFTTATNIFFVQLCNLFANQTIWNISSSFSSFEIRVGEPNLHIPFIFEFSITKNQRAQMLKLWNVDSIQTYQNTVNYRKKKEMT